MGGICGVVGHNDAPVLRRRTRKMVHRAPDDEGFYLADGVSLGVRRLNFIDVAGGRQDGTLVTVDNGEIYNHRELLSRLGPRDFVSSPAAIQRRRCTFTKRAETPPCTCSRRCSRRRSVTRRGRWREGPSIWALLCHEVWACAFLDGDRRGGWR